MSGNELKQPRRSRSLIPVIVLGILAIPLVVAGVFVYSLDTSYVDAQQQALDAAERDARDRARLWRETGGSTMSVNPGGASP